MFEVKVMSLCSCALDTGEVCFELLSAADMIVFTFRSCYGTFINCSVHVT